MIGKISFRVALIGAGTALALGLGPANAGEIDDLKAQIKALQERLGKIEAAQKEAAKTAVTAGETGGFKMPGSGTSISISGYVKGDFYIDSDNDLGTTFGNAAGIRLDGEAGDDDDDGAFGAHATQSRVRIGSSTDTDHGALNTVLEGDFNPYGPTRLRLRQAYGELGPVLAGQAWSIRGDDHTYADTVEFDGPAGVVATRTPQIRLTLPLGEGLYGQMAVEPAIRGNEVPTFLAALRYSSGWGAVNVTGAVGRYDDDSGQNVTTHSLHVGAHLNATDATRVMATLNMTRGDAQIYGGDGAVGTDAFGDLEAHDSIGGFAGVSHGWSDSMRSGVYYGWAKNDNPAAANESVQTVHANVIWSPVPQADIGAEIIHGMRETPAGAEGDATRFQIGVKYGF